MNRTINIQDKDGNTITTVELFEDVYQRIVHEAAHANVTFKSYFLRIITDHAQGIIDRFEGEK